MDTLNSSVNAALIQSCNSLIPHRGWISPVREWHRLLDVGEIHILKVSFLCYNVSVQFFVYWRPGWLLYVHFDTESYYEEDEIVGDGDGRGYGAVDYGLL